MAKRYWIFLILTSCIAQTAVFPLRDVRAGLHGVGKTVFVGDTAADFQVEILGVLDNLGPKQSVILARLSGGSLEKTGVIQGMSGSPVYINGKLIGAVALAFNFSKDAIAGIRPIEEMLRPQTGDREMRLRATASPLGPELALTLPSFVSASGGGRLSEISTPVSFNGFTAQTLDQFAPQLRVLGLEPRQGTSGGGAIPQKLGPPSALHPGDMISVQLLSGDMSAGADGTVTAIDGNRIYAFGHRFLAMGDTELPFARASVITVLSSLSSSFKISTAREWMGTITEDRSTAISGELGRVASAVPVSITVDGARGRTAYHLRMVNDRTLSPFLLQMAVYSALDATERTLGAGSFTLRGKVEFAGGVEPLSLDNSYAGDFNVPLQASLGVAAPVAYALAAGFDAMKLKSVELNVSASQQRRILQIDQVTPSRRDVHPGDAVELTVTLLGANGVETVRKIRFQTPIGTPPGPLFFTVADALTTNTGEFQQTIGVPSRSATQLVTLLNTFRINTKAYVRVWRADTAFQMQGQTLAGPPPSLALILAKDSSALTSAQWNRGSTIAEIALDGSPDVVAGSKTVQVEVQE